MDVGTRSGSWALAHLDASLLAAEGEAPDGSAHSEEVPAGRHVRSVEELVVLQAQRAAAAEEEVDVEDGLEALPLLGEIGLGEAGRAAAPGAAGWLQNGRDATQHFPVLQHGSQREPETGELLTGQSLQPLRRPLREVLLLLPLRLFRNGGHPLGSTNRCTSAKITRAASRGRTTVSRAARAGHDGRARRVRSGNSRKHSAPPPNPFSLSVRQPDGVGSSS